ASFTLVSGKLAFLPPMHGRTYAAVFTGEGVFRFQTPDGAERYQLRRFLKKQEDLEEKFTELVLYFADDTDKELLSQGKAMEGPAESFRAPLEHTRDLFRDKLRQNEEATVLSELLLPKSEYFLARMTGKQFGNMIYSFTPGDGEEVTLMRHRGGQSLDVWNSFSPPGRKPATPICDAISLDLDTAIENNAQMSSTAVLEFQAVKAGPRLINFHLAPTLRVESVKDQDGTELAFIQEHEKHDAGLYVAAPVALTPGQKYRWTFRYAGKDVVEKAGNGNFFVGARSLWFPRPANPWEDFGDRVRFKMRFQVPKQFSLVGTGKELSRKTEGKVEITEWDSQRPATVAGFNYGKFKRKDMDANGYQVSVYANLELDDQMSYLRKVLEDNPQAAVSLGIAAGALTTTGMTNSAAAEALNCLTFYTRLFGELPDKFLRVTQQPSMSFGQSWPGLVFLPLTSFLDGTAIHQLRMDTGGMKRFLDEVGPHEVAHQWWGHAVVWRDYHDQWMSEGFAEYSAGLYVEYRKGTKQFLEFMKHLRERIMVRVNQPVRPNEAGPIWMGVRLSTEDFPSGYQLVYPKGAYVLHMLRMLGHDYKTGSDAKFLNMMRDFVKTYGEGAASTQDFEAIASKHFGADMKFFFDQWVRGTAVPHIKIEYSTEKIADKTQLTVKYEMTEVPDNFRVDLPLELKFKTGTITGRFRMAAPSGKITATLPDMPEGAEFNSLMEVLCDLDVKKKG
ncbi:MAG: M1 family aminopeptidase, partial [Bryobacteraceae bacterium]